LSNLKKLYIHYKTQCVYPYTVDSWFLVFRGTPAAVTEPYMAFVYGINVTSDDESCRQFHDTDCTKHYRNGILDSWESI